MIAQGTPEWHEERRGKVTGSRIHCLIARGEQKGRATYLRELLLERLTGKVVEGFKSSAMDRGNEYEPSAVRAYEFFCDRTAIEVGFVTHPKIDMAGASPDRLVDRDGVLEVKCPMGPAHLDLLEGKPIKREYLSQMQWEMACTGRAWCDFVSFNPDFPASMQLKVIRIERDDAAIRQLEEAARSFLAELDLEFDRLRFRYEGAAAA